MALFVLDFFVKTLTGFIAQPFFIKKLLHHTWHHERLPRLIGFGPRFVQIIGNVNRRVQSHHVRQTESPRLGATHHGAGELVHLLHGQAHCLGGADGLHHRVDAQAVGDEARCVLTEHRRFAQKQIAVVHQEVDDFGVSFGAGDNLQKPQITRWVEEVRAAEMLLEILTTAFRHQMNGNARRIGTHQSTRLAQLIDFLKQALLDVDPLHDDLDDPVVVFDFGQVVVEVAQFHALGKIRAVQRGGRAFQGALKRFGNQAVAHSGAFNRQPLGLFSGRWFAGDDVEQ